MNNGEKLHTLDSPAGWIYSVAFSPDGQVIATAGFPGKTDPGLLVWDVATGRMLRGLPGNSVVVNSVAMHPNGRYVLTGSDVENDDGTKHEPAILWDTTTGHKVRSFVGHTNDVDCVDFNSNGSQAVTGASDDTSILWDVASGRKLRTFIRPFAIVYSVAFSPDDKYVLTGNSQDEALLWNVETGLLRRRFIGHTDSVQSVSFSPDGKQVLTGSSDQTAILWDAASGRVLRTFTAHTDDVNCVTFSPDGRSILTGSDDGTAILWDVATGEPLCHFFNFSNDQWLVTTPQGLFEGSTGGREKVSYRVGGGLNVVPVDRFFKDFYYPGLLAAIWRSERPMPEVEIGKSAAPQIKITSHESGDVDKQFITIAAEATDQGGGVAKLAIYQNGARVLADGETLQEGKVTYRTFKISLVEGDNRIKVTAANLDGSWEAEPAEITLRYERPLEKPNLHVVSVGINQYSDANLNLQYAAKDCEALSELFRERGAALYKEVFVTRLLNEKATKQAIKDALKNVAAETRPQDTLLLFLAGHGAMVGQRYYFVPHELRRQADKLEDDLRSQGLPADELSDYLGAAKALKRILILDTCASGGALGTVVKTRSGFALRGAVERLSRSQGIFTIAASAATEEAQESPELGHGVLSYALLAGLQGIDGGPLDGQHVEPSNPERVVDVMEWFAFAAGQVPRLTEKYYGAAQDVQTSTIGTSFPVLPLSE